MQDFGLLTENSLRTVLGNELYNFNNEPEIQKHAALTNILTFYEFVKSCATVNSVGYDGRMIKSGKLAPPFISAFCTGLLRSTYAPLSVSLRPLCSRSVGVRAASVADRELAPDRCLWLTAWRGRTLVHQQGSVRAGRLRYLSSQIQTETLWS